MLAVKNARAELMLGQGFFLLTLNLGVEVNLELVGREQTNTCGELNLDSPRQTLADLFPPFKKSRSAGARS